MKVKRTMDDPTRRDMLRYGAVAGAGGWLPASSRAKERHVPVWPLGVQLWSVDAEMAREPDATLRRLAALGYRRVESAGLHGRTPAAFRRAVEAAGLRWDSAHASMRDLVADPAGQIGRARDGGADWLICSAPLPPRAVTPGVEWNRAMIEAMTLDAWKRNAALLGEMAVSARAAGIDFGYHNHPAEFGFYGRRRGFDVLLAETDPRLVRFELDVAWAVAGGQDPAALLRAHPGRFALLHLKDIAAPPPPGRMAANFATTELGRGAIDWRAVFAAAHRAGVRGAYVEQEGPYARPVFESLAISRDYIRALATGGRSRGGARRAL